MMLTFTGNQSATARVQEVLVPTSGFVERVCCMVRYNTPSITVHNKAYFAMQIRA